MFSLRLKFLAVLLVLLKLANSDGQLDSRIVGGHKAGRHYNYKSIVSIRIGPRRTHACGGTILSPNVILTAAHCAFGLPLVSVSYGSIYVTNTIDNQININRAIIHDRYNSHNQTHDIALLLLQRSIVFTDRVQPINLTSLSKQQQDVHVIGWGAKRETAQKGSRVLRFVEMATIPDAECKLYLSHESSLGDLLLEDNLCTLAKKGTGDCFGDSGGPLLSTDGDQGGIVSWGSSGCANDRPNVYVDVSKYVGWINEKTGLRLELQENHYEKYEEKSRMQDFLAVHFGN